MAGLSGMFEIAEFGLDSFFGLNLQGVFSQNLQKIGELSILENGLEDTTVDMLFGMIGSLIYILYIAIFSRDKKK
jgi:hypothetical protein